MMRSLPALLSLAGTLLQGPIGLTAASPFLNLEPDHGSSLIPRADDRVALRIMPLGASIVNGVGSDPEHNGFVMKCLAAG